MEYEFKDGILCHKTTGLPYYKEGRNDYEEIGEHAYAYIYEKLIEYGLKCVTIPEHRRPPQDPVSFIFASESLLIDRADKLLVLIHGSGDVRAGVWSRYLLTHESVNVGSQLSYVRRALSNGYAVLVMNTNLNKEPSSSSSETSKIKQQNNQPDNVSTVNNFVVGERTWLKMARQGRVIDCSKSPEEHALYVWRNFVHSQRSLRKIAIVAHSYGALVTSYLISQFAEDVKKRVFAICLTDSTLQLQNINEETKRHVLEVTRSWKCDVSPLDHKLKDKDNRSEEMVSAGTTEHARSSHAAFQSVFTFIENAFDVPEDNELSLPLPNFGSQTESYLPTAAPLSTALMFSNLQASSTPYVSKGLNLPTIPDSSQPNSLITYDQHMLESSDSELQEQQLSIGNGNDVNFEAASLAQESTAVHHEHRVIVENLNAEENIDLGATPATVFNPLSNFAAEKPPIHDSNVQPLPHEPSPVALIPRDNKKEVEKKKRSSSYKRTEQPTAVRVENYSTYQSIDSTNRSLFDDDEDLNWTDQF